MLNIVIQYGLAFIWMVLIPFLMGGVFLKVLRKNERFLIVSALATGIVLSYTLYQVPAMIFVLLDMSFRRLTLLFTIFSLLFAVWGAVQWYFYLKKEQPFKKYKISIPKDPFFLAAVILIGIQIAVILIQAAPDKDDAFYTGLSSMSLTYDYVLKYNAYDGIMQAPVSWRYIMSGLPAYQASLSLLSGQLHTLIICHNLYPLFYMPLSYGLYYMIADKWMEKKENMGRFLLFFACLHMFGNYFVFSVENFLITRIWQGKALFVTIGIPYIYYFLCRAWDETGLKKALPYFGMVSLGLCASAFMGETGLYLGLVLTAMAALANAIVKRKFKNVIYAAICCVPELILMGIFLL